MAQGGAENGLGEAGAKIEVTGFGIRGFGGGENKFGWAVTGAWRGPLVGIRSVSSSFSMGTRQTVQEPA